MHSLSDTSNIIVFISLILLLLFLLILIHGDLLFILFFVCFLALNAQLPSRLCSSGMVFILFLSLLGPSAPFSPILWHLWLPLSLLSQTKLRIPPEARGASAVLQLMVERHWFPWAWVALPSVAACS